MRFADWMKGQDAHGRFGPPAGDAEVEHITCDIRDAGPGWAFAALRGGVRDGAEFVPAALRQGARQRYIRNRSESLLEEAAA